MYFYKFHIITSIMTFIVSTIAIDIPIFDEAKLLHNVLPHVPTFPEIAKKNGLKCEEYNVTTSDGYILRVFRIPGDFKRPVLLMHGLLDSANGFIIREENSLAVMLAREGYDIWVGNNRGNRYARNHITLNPDKDEEFWDFSFHDMGMKDLPATIDLVLDKTGQTQLSAVGHSEGTTIFYVLGSKRPEYNEKIKVLAALSPVAYIQNIKGLFAILLEAAPALIAIVKSINYQEALGFDSDLKSLIREICAIPVVGYEICSIVAFLICGFDVAQLEPKFLPTLIANYPAGGSSRAFIHYGQVGSRKQFAEFDYGPVKNLKLYDSVNPPLYNLTDVTFDVALYCGANDFLSTLEDVSILKSQLPNVVKYEIIDYPLWNHLDPLYGKFMPKYLRPLLLEILAKYNT